MVIVSTLGAPGSSVGRALDCGSRRPGIETGAGLDSSYPKGGAPAATTLLAE